MENEPVQIDLSEDSNPSLSSKTAAQSPEAVSEATSLEEGRFQSLHFALLPFNFAAQAFGLQYVSRLNS